MHESERLSTDVQVDVVGVRGGTGLIDVVVLHSRNVAAASDILLNDALGSDRPEGMVSDRVFGAVTVLEGQERGAFPYGNSVLVAGSAQQLLIDPALGVDGSVRADAVVISHAHEDHIAGLRYFSAPVYTHHRDVEAVASLEVLLDSYGLDPADRPEVARIIDEQFGLPSRHHGVQGVDDGEVLDLGDRTATLVHLPGHTPGHSGVLIEPDGFFYVADIDLTSFGPLYGDLHSSVDDFLASIDRAGAIDARWYGTFHQKGVVEGADEFRKRLRAYREIIFRREERLLEFLTEPHTIGEIADYRLVYRPHVDAPYVSAVELRTAQLHVERLVGVQQVELAEPGRYVRVR